MSEPWLQWAQRQGAVYEPSSWDPGSGGLCLVLEATPSQAEAVSSPVHEALSAVEEELLVPVGEFPLTGGGLLSAVEEPLYPDEQELLSMAWEPLSLAWTVVALAW